jgi:hypothetical protein
MNFSSPALYSPRNSFEIHTRTDLPLIIAIYILLASYPLDETPKRKVAVKCLAI